ncbi:MAG: helix-turn-helix transcriptional regulator [Lachnospiraceae bacterium]|nr:helix-turn-helix transcriptional regulator [Lachnospiraceae bacterium]
MKNEEFKLPHSHGETGNINEMENTLSRSGCFERVTDIFSQVSDPNRLKIFWLLCHYEECVINISAIMHMSSPAVSHHLKTLKSSGLITSRRDGKEVYYKAADTPVCHMLLSATEELMEASCPIHGQKGHTSCSVCPG